MDRFCRQLSLVFGSALLSCFSVPAQPVLADEWQTLSPVDAGFAPEVAAQPDDAVRRGELPNLRAVVVARHGKLVLERYYEGPNERWGQPLGTVAFGPGVEHDVRSISKSIVGLLCSIALAEGRAADARSAACRSVFRPIRTLSATRRAGA
jgi:hypothetical protein